MRDRARLSLLLVLLLGTNLAWWWTRDPAPATPTLPPADVDALRQRIAGLEAELASARTPTLGPVSRPAPPAEDGAARQRDVARREATARREAATARRAEALRAVKALVADAQQIGDGALRERSLAALEGMIRAGGADEAAAALGSLLHLKDAGMDRERTRALALSRMADDDAGVRRAALYALAVHPLEDGDLTYALRAAEDDADDVRDAASHLLALYTNRRLHGAAGEAVLGLLHQPVRERLTEVLRGLWGADCSEAIHARLLELAQDPALRHDVIYFGLSTLEPKSPAVVQALVAAMLEGGQDAGRAQWGLGRGIPRELSPTLADAVLAALPRAGSAAQAVSLIALLERHGDRSHAPALTAYAGNEFAPALAREAAARVAAKLR